MVRFERVSPLNFLPRFYIFGWTSLRVLFGDYYFRRGYYGVLYWRATTVCYTGVIKVGYYGVLYWRDQSFGSVDAFRSSKLDLAGVLAVHSSFLSFTNSF